VVNAEYPLTPERAQFVAFARANFKRVLSNWPVEWDRYGLDENIWLNALLYRVDAWRKANPGRIVSVTNVRFENELKRLAAAGWTHFHSICSTETWTKRLAKAGLTPDSPEVKDHSEQLARALDADVTRRVSQRSGKKLRVIWNDRDVPSPSEQLYRTDEFVRTVLESVQPAGAPTPEPEPEPMVDLGDIALDD